MSREVDVDDAIKAVGGFGYTQKKVFYLVGLYQTVLACHILVLSFIGEDPGWSCQVNTKQGSAPVTEASEKCHLYDRGNCTPEYNPQFTSIVTEVMHIYLRQGYTPLSARGNVLYKGCFVVVRSQVGREELPPLTIVGLSRV